MNIKHAIITTLLTFILVISAGAKPLTLDEVLEGSCRISVPSALGSGVCIAHQDGNYIFLTNAHVVGTYKTAYVELFRDGRKSYKIPAKVLKIFWEERTDKDFALLSVEDKHVYKVPPRVIPLVPLGYDIKTGYAYSAGCPEGRWLCGWEGTIEKKESTRIIFTPPPVGGQSGSGLLVNIRNKNGELETRVAAIVSIRIGEDLFSDRSDVNGFPLAKGAALPVSTLYKLLKYDNVGYTPTKFPSNYSYLAAEPPCRHCERPARTGHALGSDGHYYCVRITESGEFSCTLNDDVTIVRWPNRERVIPIPEILRPDTPEDGNPFGGQIPSILPPEDQQDNIEDLPVPDSCTIELEELRKKNLELEGTIRQLEQQIKEGGEDYDSLLQQKNQLEEELRLNKNRLVEKEHDLTLSLSAVDDLNSQIEEVTETTTELKVKLDESKVKLDESVEAEKTAEKQRTWLGWLSGGLGVGILSLFGRMYWNSRGRQKSRDFIDNVQDRVDDKIDDYIGEDITNRLHDFVDGLQEMAEQAVDNALEKKTADVQEVESEVELNEELVDERGDDKPPPPEKSEKPEKSEEKVVASPPREYNKTGKPRRPAKSAPVSFTINNNNTNINDAHDVQDYKVNDSILREFFSHKEKDGEKLEDWALYGILYKEAVEQLAKGKLYYKGKTKLQGQKKTAERIHNWVRAEFLKNLTRRAVFNQDELHREAMLGFLYKDAVDRLAAGEFPVLGYQNTAEAIRNWVNKEFLRRINVVV